MSKKTTVEEEEETPHHHDHGNDKAKKPESRDSVEAFAAAVPTISTVRLTNNEMGATSAGSTSSPGLGVAAATKPTQYSPNGGFPVLAALMPFAADGTSKYLPMPLGAVLLEAQVFVLTAGAATTVKLGNDGTVGAADLGTVSVSTVGAVNLPLLGAVVAGLTGSSLQVTVGTDATLQCVLAVQYVVLR